MRALILIWYFDQEICCVCHVFKRNVLSRLHVQDVCNMARSFSKTHSFNFENIFLSLHILLHNTFLVIIVVPQFLLYFFNMLNRCPRWKGCNIAVGLSGDALLSDINTFLVKVSTFGWFSYVLFALLTQSTIHAEGIATPWYSAFCPPPLTPPHMPNWVHLKEGCKGYPAPRPTPKCWEVTIGTVLNPTRPAAKCCGGRWEFLS